MGARKQSNEPPASHAFGDLSFLAGQVGAILRAADGKAFSLGPPAHWPENLRTALGICLAAPNPACISWGPDRIGFYNDACLPLVGGNHPRVLGSGFLDAWPEAWKTQLQAAVDRVEKEGQTVQCADLPFLSNSPSSDLKSSFSFSFMPIRGEGGHVDGTFAFLHETRSRHLSDHSIYHLATIVEQSEDAIISKTLDGIITSWNRGAEALFGYTAEEMVGRPVAVLIPPERHDEEPAILNRLRHGLRIAHYETVRRRKDGTDVPISLRISPIKDRQGIIIGASKVAREITERKRMEKALTDSEERFRSLADNITQLAWMADATGALFWYNQRWFDYTGTTLDEMKGWGWKKVHHPEHVDRVVEKFSRHVQTGQTWEDTFPLRSRGGSYRWFLSRAVPIRDERGNVLRWFGTNTDISAQRQVEQDLKQARDEAVAASRAKDDFLATLSHELRTPLSPVLLLASEAAANPHLPAVARSDFELIRKQVELEARLIDDLLDLTSITRGKLTFERRKIDVHEVLREAIEKVQSDLSEKEIRFIQELNATDTEIWGDPVRLQQVFWNLLKNAIKFTPQGGTITVKSVLTESGQGLHLQFIDTGIGIVSEDLEIVFESFTQGKRVGRGDSHTFGGLGIGLAISRAIVKNLGGRISAHSEGADRGATFLVELPIANSLAQGEAVSSPEPPEIVQRLPSSRWLPTSRILLVEDHEATRKAVLRLLARRRFVVRAADSVAAALALAQHETFELVISDIGLPDGTGFELMADLQRLYGLKGIALTGYGRDDDIARSKAAGFATHLTKPVRVQALEQALSAVLTETMEE